MSSGLGPLPPIDPQHDRALRQGARRRQAESLVGIVLFFALLLTQLLMTVPLGVWVTPAGIEAGYAMMGLLLVLLGAHALGFACLLLLGGASLLLRLPRLFRRRPPETGPARTPSERSPLSLGMALGMATVHGAILVAGALLLAVAFAAFSDAVALGDAWRFLVAAVVLAVPTPGLLWAWAQADA